MAEGLRVFFAAWPAAVVLEDGKVLFDLREASFAVSCQQDRCTLELFGSERNLVRRVVATELRGKTLRLNVLRFGHTQTTLLEVVGDRERRAASTRELTRQRYGKVLERALLRQFPEWKSDGFRTAMDLEKSFGPAYARGLLVRGQQAWAVIGVNEEETPVTVDGVLTLGILWLALCRERAGGRRVVSGLKVVTPRGMSNLTRARMTWLRGPASAWELWELDQRDEEMTQQEVGDDGNLASHLVQAPHVERARERFRASLERVMGMVPEAYRAVIEQRLRSGSELALLLHGLEFARIRTRASGESFQQEQEISVGTGAQETRLHADNKGALRELIAQLCERRRAQGDKRDVLYRMQPERWLEGELRRNLLLLDRTLRAEHVYAQVPAYAGGDRGMLDLLSVTADGRLAVIEIKADEDPQAALQGLDYWIRVRWHHAQNPDRASGLGEFERHGYFAGVALSEQPPRLFLVTPALRLHPAVEVVLQALSPRVEWTLIALDERWRSGIKVVFRKQSGAS